MQCKYLMTSCGYFSAKGGRIIYFPFRDLTNTFRSAVWTGQYTLLVRGSHYLTVVVYSYFTAAARAASHVGHAPQRSFQLQERRNSEKNTHCFPHYFHPRCRPAIAADGARCAMLMAAPSRGSSVDALSRTRCLHASPQTSAVCHAN